MGRQYFSEILEPVMVADQTAVTGVTVETSLWTATLYSALPANFVQPGKLIRIAVWGLMTTAATPGTAIITPRWGTTTSGTTLGATGTAVALTASKTNVPWFMEAKLVCRTVGTAGTAVLGGNFSSEAVGNISFGGTSATIDTTVASGLFFGYTPSVTTQSVTTKGLLLEALN